MRSSAGTHWLFLILALSACGEEPPLPPPGPSSLTSPDPDERKKALYALTPEARKENLPKLLEMSQHDPNSSVRQLSIGMAGTTGDSAGIPIFVEILTDFDDTGTQLAAATALGNLENPDACDAMLDALIAWPEPKTDMVVNELKDAIARARLSCKPAVKARLEAYPTLMQELLDEMHRKSKQ